MYRFPISMMLLAASALAATGATTADNACPDQPVHSYPLVVSNGNDASVASDVTHVAAYTPNVAVNGVQTVHVADSNVSDCNGAGGTPLGGPDGFLGDWDGDYDTGDRGAFFGHGPWAVQPDPCGYYLNLHGPNVAVQDFVFGSTVPFLVGEVDQFGPTTMAGICFTDGAITPVTDADDCLSDADPAGPGYQPYYGTGVTCGPGGGDGGYWVILVEPYLEEQGLVWTAASPPVAGTITAS